MSAIGSSISSAVDAPISSVREFYEKYSLTLSQNQLRVTDLVSESVLANLEMKAEKNYRDTACPEKSHFHKGKLYFCLGSYEHTGEYLFRYDLATQKLKEVIGVTCTHLIKNLVVDFATGFTKAEAHLRPEAVIAVYDLNRPEGEQRAGGIQFSNGQYGWGGFVNETSQFIEVYDRYSRKSFEFSLNPRVDGSLAGPGTILFDALSGRRTNLA